MTPSRADLFSYVVGRVRAGDFTVSGLYRIVLDCPFPDCRAQSRKSHHFYVNRDWQTWKCYRTGERGRLTEEALVAPGSWAVVRATAGAFLAPERSRGTLGDPSLSELSGDAGKVPSGQRSRAYNYLLGRGVSPVQIAEYKLAVRPFDHRIYFPVWDAEGRTFFRMGRSTAGEAGPKTLEEGAADKPLYGPHVREPAGLLLLVEGVFDHFATPRSAALMGSDLTASELDALEDLATSGRVDRVAVLLDPDAKSKAAELSRRLRLRGVPAVPALLEGTDRDPGDLGRPVMSRVGDALARVPASAFRAGSPQVVTVRTRGVG